MSSLYLKHRPTTLKQVVGNKAAISAMETVLARKEGAPRAVLFTGPSGCGKTTMARIFKDAVGCIGSDFIELDSADFRGIDTVRDIRLAMGYGGVEGPCRVWLMDECHQLTKDAQSALLKALEDTPSHVYFILATTDPEKLLPTIRNRCTQFEVKPLTDDEMSILIERVLRAEKTNIPDDAFDAIITNALGSPRMCLVLLDKIISMPEKDMAEAAAQFAEEASETIALCRALIKGAPYKALATIVAGLKQEPESIRRAVLGYCSSILSKADNSRAYLVMTCFSRNYYDSGKAGLVMSVYEAAHLK